jgi:hypothetical protein
MRRLPLLGAVGLILALGAAGSDIFAATLLSGRAPVPCAQISLQTRPAIPVAAEQLAFKCESVDQSTPSNVRQGDQTFHDLASVLHQGMLLGIAALIVSFIVVGVKTLWIRDAEVSPHYGEEDTR